MISRQTKETFFSDWWWCW